MKTYEVNVIVIADEGTTDTQIGSAISEILHNGLVNREYDYIGSADVEASDEMSQDMAPLVIPCIRQ